MKLDWKALLGIAISVLLLWWVFRGEDPGAIWAQIRQADLWLLTLAVAVVTSVYLLRALRWKILLTPLRGDTTLHNRFAAVNIGFMANNLFPARIGEFARAYALSRLEAVSLSGSFGSLVVERALDGVTILLLLVATLLSPAFPEGATVGGQPIDVAIRGVVAALVVVIMILVVLLAWPRPVLRMTEAVARRLPGHLSEVVVRAAESFLGGLGSLQSPVLLGKAFVWSLVIWLWNSFGFWIAFLAFDIDLGFTAAVFVQSAVAVFVSVPSAPGFFGTYHAGVKVGLTEVFGVSAGKSLSYAVGFHLGGFLPVTLLGLWYAWRLGLSLREVEASEERIERAVERGNGMVPAGGGPGRGGEAGGGGAERSVRPGTGDRRPLGPAPEEEDVAMPGPCGSQPRGDPALRPDRSGRRDR